MLGDDYTSYEDALLELNLPSLRERRLTLCQRFAKKMSTHPDFASWFLPRDCALDRAAKNKANAKLWTDVPARTQRLYRSPISYLVSCLNDNFGPPPERLEDDEDVMLDDWSMTEDEEEDDDDDDDWIPYR